MIKDPDRNKNHCEECLFDYCNLVIGYSHYTMEL
jgi:hypothetical protein